MQTRTSLDRANDAWFPSLPQWVAALAKACEISSQGQVARRLNVSRTAVSRVLRNDYPHEPARLREKVVRELMEASVYCPVMGTITSQECQTWQGRVGAKPKPNSQWTRMDRTCRCCALYQGKSI